MIFVTVGSMMPFNRLIDTMDRWAAARPDVEMFAQIGGGDELLQLLVDLAGATPLADPEVAVQALRSDVGNRFAFDILLRVLLWNGPGDAREAYGPLLDDLRSREGSRLYGVLRDLRSHPTELIARHAAELLVQHGFGSKASNIWFDLSLALTEAGEGSIGRLPDQIALLCYGYDPVHGIYTLAIRRILAGTAVLMILALVLALVLLRHRSSTNAEAP